MAARDGLDDEPVTRRVRIGADGKPSPSFAEQMTPAQSEAFIAAAREQQAADQAAKEAPFEEPRQMLAEALGRTEDGQVIILAGSGDLAIRTGKDTNGLRDRLNEIAEAAGLPADTFKSNRDMKYSIAVDADVIKGHPELMTAIKQELGQGQSLGQNTEQGLRITQFAEATHEEKLKIQSVAIALDQLNGTNLFGNDIFFNEKERAQVEQNLNAFKESKGLPPDGIVDKRTMEALSDELHDKGLKNTHASHIIDDQLGRPVDRHPQNTTLTPPDAELARQDVEDVLQTKVSLVKIGDEQFVTFRTKSNDDHFKALEDVQKIYPGALASTGIEGDIAIPVSAIAADKDIVNNLKKVGHHFNPERFDAPEQAPAQPQQGSPGDKARLDPETGQLVSSAPTPVGVVGVEAIHKPVETGTEIPVTQMGASQGQTAPIPVARPDEQGREILTDRESIKQAQQALKDLGHDMDPANKFQNDGVDGLKGRVTTGEIKKFQEENGLAATGEITKETLQKLEEKQAEKLKEKDQSLSAPEVSPTLAMSAESAAAQVVTAAPAPSLPAGLEKLDLASLGAAVAAAKGMGGTGSITIADVEHDHPVAAKAGGGVKPAVEAGAFLA